PGVRNELRDALVVDLRERVEEVQVVTACGGVVADLRALCHCVNRFDVERLLAVPAVGTANALVGEAPGDYLSQLPVAVGRVAVTACVRARIRRNVRRGVRVSDCDRNAAPVEGCPAFVGGAELRAHIPTWRVRERLAVERRLIRRDLLPVVGRARLRIPESR